MNQNPVTPPDSQKDKEKKYIILRTLGRGSFGKVKEALHVLSGEKIAIKILEKARIKKDEDLVRIKREIKIHSQCSHPNIVKLYEVPIPYSNSLRSSRPKNIFSS